jgi:hypothetical protein
MGHPPYCPDLAPSDLYLFRPIKKHLDGKGFATDADVQQAVSSRLLTLDTDFFYAGIKELVSRLEQCFNVTNDYVELINGLNVGNFVMVQNSNFVCLFVKLYAV